MLLWIASLSYATEFGTLESRLLSREPAPLPSLSADPPAWVVRQGGGPPLDTLSLLTILDDPDAWQAYRRLQRRDLVRGVGWAVGSGAALAAGLSMAAIGGAVVLDPRRDPGAREARARLPLALAGGATALVASGTVWLAVLPWERRRLRSVRPDTFFDDDGMDLYVDSHNLWLQTPR